MNIDKNKIAIIYN